MTQSTKYTNASKCDRVDVTDICQGKYMRA